MGKAVNYTDGLRDEYINLFAVAQIRPERKFVVTNTVNNIFAPERWAIYQAVATPTGVPAYVVGIIHSLEASLNFGTHLHNGDPLRARTVQVPKGRPKTGSPPFKWSDSAIDALTMHGLDRWTDWSIPGIAYVLENYNGWGYRLYHSHVKSPYLWSFTTAYNAGKYVADGQWSERAASGQCGGMALLKQMIALGKVDLGVPEAPQQDEPVSQTPHLPSDGATEPADPAAPPYPGYMIVNGMRNADVEQVQRRLLALGIWQVGALDGDFGEKTEWAVGRVAARGIDDTGEPLEIDGIVGAKTWAALFGQPEPAEPDAAQPVGGSLLNEVLKVAASQIGVREKPLGSNRGPEVDQYLSSVSRELLGQPWCMAFVYWSFAQAARKLGKANPAPKTASVWRSWELAQSQPGAMIVPAASVRKNPSLVTPGMVFFINTGGRSGHTGLVADIVGGTLVTIEGNTNDGGSREGIGVFTRSRRRIDSINLGFIAFD